MKKVFVKVLSLCTEAGLVKMGHLFLDGMQLKDNAAHVANGTYERRAPCKSNH
jgi:hypothetical protein